MKADEYLLVKFLFCLFFFHVYLPPVMVNKDVCIVPHDVEYKTEKYVRLNSSDV